MRRFNQGVDRYLQTQAKTYTFVQCLDFHAFEMLILGHPTMQAIKTYPTRVDVDLARVALEAAGVPSVVVGTDVAMEGGAAGVQLLVPDECVAAALRVLEHS
jgi:hypothetical protein